MAENLPPPFFIADSVALDFLNTHAVPVDTQVEWIGSGEDLLGWLEVAGLVPTEVLSALRRKAVRGELDSIAAQARKLREWFRAFVQTHAGKPLKSKNLQELEPLNRVLRRDEEFGQVVARNRAWNRRLKIDAYEDEPVSGLVWSAQRRWKSPDSVLFPIAKAMAELVCEVDFTLVKPCEGSNCTLFFVDRTRGHARRWCSMAVCGNRAKQAAYRERAQLARN